MQQFDDIRGILEYENKINMEIKVILGDEPSCPPNQPSNLYQRNGPSVPQIKHPSTIETKVPQTQEIATGIFVK